MDSNDDKNKVLNPTVVKLGLVALLADISSEMLYPITPIFITSVLGASMASLGLVEGFAEAIASLLKTYSGAWSDKLASRKPFIVGGYALSAIAKPVIGISSHWGEVLLARALDRTGKGFRSGPRDALIADAVDRKLLGAAFGWHRAMDTIGAALGPLIALLYLSKFSDNLRGIFLWALIPGALAVALTLTVKEKKVVRAAGPVSKKSMWAWSGLTPSFRQYLVTWGIFSLVNSSDVFLLLKTKQSGISLQGTILIYCFYNLIYALASPSLGQLSDRVGRKPLLLFGFLTFAFVYGCFAMASRPWQFWILFGIYGLYIAATDGVGKAFAIDLIDSSKRATGVGMLGTVTGISTLIASTVAGALWDHFGAGSTFLFGAAGALVAAASLSLIPSNK